MMSSGLVAYILKDIKNARLRALEGVRHKRIGAFGQNVSQLRSSSAIRKGYVEDNYA